MNLPGRFLMKDPVRNVWHEFGHTKACDKTLQGTVGDCLRKFRGRVSLQQQQEGAVGL